MDPCTAPKARERERERDRERERKRERERERERGKGRLECRQAILHLFTFATTHHHPSGPLSVSLRGEAISSSTPVITSTNVQGIAFRDRTLEAEENANSMESPG